MESIVLLSILKRTSLKVPRNLTLWRVIRLFMLFLRVYNTEGIVVAANIDLRDRRVDTIFSFLLRFCVEL